MSLSSVNFIVCFFLLILFLLVLDFLIKNQKEKCRKFQIGLILTFNYYYIFCFDVRFCICAFVTSFIAWKIGDLIKKTKSYRGRIWIMRVGIIILLGSLVYYKYTNFFIESINFVFKRDFSLWKLLLPVGISFYTFSAVSYVIDIYRNKYDAIKSFYVFSLYISFFPKFIAGPIVQGDEFFPQLRKWKGLEKDNILVGVQIFIFGLFKKIVLADHLVVFVDDVFYAPSAYHSATVMWGILSYALQIYFDFSGYSDMAIGTARILGFKFKPNFNLPYVASGFSDFWRRWHISLSAWFRDYLYIPLGGSRCGTTRTCINLLMVMLVSGLWHGAGVLFILWGGLHGLACCCDYLCRGAAKNKIIYWIKIPATFFCVTFLWIIFRARDYNNALEVIKSAFLLHDGIVHPYTWTFISVFCLLVSTIVAYKKSYKLNLRDKSGCLKIEGFYPILSLNRVFPLTVFLIFIGLTIILGYYGNTVFIYSQF